MKNNIVKQIFLAGALILGLASCEDRDLVTLTDQTAPIVMDLSAETLVLDENFPTNDALTITWDRSTFNVPLETKYSVEISATEAFETSYELARTTQSINFVSFTVLQMNNAAKNIGLVPYEAQKMYFRVVSTVGEGSVPQTSNVSNITITPYRSSPVYSYTDLYLIGDATAAGWDNAAGNMNQFPLSKTSSANVYTFTGFFKTGGFKMVRVKGSWDAQFGLGSANGLLSTDGGSGNIPVTADGYYKVTVDTSALTYTLEAVSAPTITYTTLGIIGSATPGGWDSDTAMTATTHDPHLWYLGAQDLSAGELKFRANGTWDVNWGTNAEYFGTATAGGANIPVSSEWTYDIYFNDFTGDYTIIPVE